VEGRVVKVEDQVSLSFDVRQGLASGQVVDGDFVPLPVSAGEEAVATDRGVVSGREAFARAGLAGGQFVQWLLFAMGFVLFYGLQTALNYAFSTFVNAPIIRLRSGGSWAWSVPGGFILAVNLV
jgi:hypothetical protein